MTKSDTALPSITELHAALAARKAAATEAAQACFNRIEADNTTINAYLALDREGALKKAAEIDAAAAKGEPLPALAGVPIGIKDVLTQQGLPATAGSKILERYRPPYTATAVQRLADAGAVLLGKLNCDEFAMGSSNENSAYGPVRNPRATDRVPGGSSGGSAAAVAARMAVATLGTDTGGSIRQPASFCGVVGVLPTYGRVSRYGLIAFASSLDRIGPFAANVRDAATVLGVIAGHDPMDATSSSEPVPNYTASIDAGVRGLRLGVPAEYFAEGLDPEVRCAVEAAIEQLRAAGAEIKPISLPHTRRRAHVLRHRHRRSQRQPRPLRRSALRLPRARLQRPLRHVPPLARRRIRPRSQATHPARHLRPQRRLLRCVLQEGPAGPSSVDE